MSNQAEDPDAAFKRAADFNDNFLGLPGYADDSMLFCLRYGDKARGTPVWPGSYHIAQRTMRQKDYQDFMAGMELLMKLWSTPAAAATAASASADDDETGVEARYRRIAEVRAETLARIGEYAELSRDFDRFVAASRAFKRSLEGSNLQVSSSSSFGS